jgi:hypothetical protein
VNGRSNRNHLRIFKAAILVLSSNGIRSVGHLVPVPEFTFQNLLGRHPRREQNKDSPSVLFAILIFPISATDHIVSGAATVSLSPSAIPI